MVILHNSNIDVCVCDKNSSNLLWYGRDSPLR